MRTDLPNRLLGISPLFTDWYSFPTEIDRNADAAGIDAKPVFGSMDFVIFQGLPKGIFDPLQPDTRTTEARKKTAEVISRKVSALKVSMRLCFRENRLRRSPTKTRSQILCAPYTRRLLVVRQLDVA